MWRKAPSLLQAAVQASLPRTAAKLVAGPAGDQVLCSLAAAAGPAACLRIADAHSSALPARLHTISWPGSQHAQYHAAAAHQQSAESATPHSGDQQQQQPQPEGQDLQSQPQAQAAQQQAGADQRPQRQHQQHGQSQQRYQHSVPGRPRSYGLRGGSGGGEGQPARRRQQPEAHIKVYYPVCISNVPKLTLRSDILDFLSDCGLQKPLALEDVRVQYSDALVVHGFWVDLPTAAERAKVLAKHFHFLGPRKAYVRAREPAEMKAAILAPLAMGSRGRYVLVAGVQENTSLEDLLRFFAGYDLMGNSITLLKAAKDYSQLRAMTKGKFGTAHRAVVRFASFEEAQRAVRNKHLGFLHNSPVRLRQLP